MKNRAGAGGRVVAGLIAALIAAGVAGCGISVPADPDGTTERVTGGTLRVGVSHNPPWTDTDDPAEPAGTDVELVERFADRLDAEIEWTDGSEARLVDALERGELDLVVAGFRDDTPWADRAAATRPYTEVVNERGETEKHILLAPMGENAFLVALEGFFTSSEAAR